MFELNKLGVASATEINNTLTDVLFPGIEKESPFISAVAVKYLVCSVKISVICSVATKEVFVTVVWTSAVELYVTFVCTLKVVLVVPVFLTNAAVNVSL